MKFVIHHHTGNPREEAHYDVMIESGDALLTWRVSEAAMELFLEGKEVSARRIADHRKAYLTYEGPISCDRGMVKIMDSGECNLLKEEKELLHYAVTGNTLRGTISIRKKKNSLHLIQHSPSGNEKMR